MITIPLQKVQTSVSSFIRKPNFNVFQLCWENRTTAKVFRGKSPHLAIMMKKWQKNYGLYREAFVWVRKLGFDILVTFLSICASRDIESICKKRDQKKQVDIY